MENPGFAEERAPYMPPFFPSSPNLPRKSEVRTSTTARNRHQSSLSQHAFTRDPLVVGVTQMIWEVSGFGETLVCHRPPNPPRDPDPPRKSASRISELARRAAAVVTFPTFLPRDSPDMTPCRRLWSIGAWWLIWCRAPYDGFLFPGTDVPRICRQPRTGV